MPFKILTSRLPKKWQADLRETLADAVAPSASDTKPDESDNAILVTAEGPQIVDNLVRWIQRMNRQQKSNKPAAKSFPSQGISIMIERADGNRITLSERNAGVVKQFLAIAAERG